MEGLTKTRDINELEKRNLANKYWSEPIETEETGTDDYGAEGHRFFGCAKMCINYEIPNKFDVSIFEQLINYGICTVIFLKLFFFSKFVQK